MKETLAFVADYAGAVRLVKLWKRHGYGVTLRAGSGATWHVSVFSPADGRLPLPWSSDPKTLETLSRQIAEPTPF